MRVFRMFRGAVLFRALINRPFALLWAGQTVSRLGDSLFAVVLAWWVLKATGSAAAMGAVLICSTVPELLCLLVGGVAVDRFSRFGVLLGSDLLRAAVVGLVAVLAWQGSLGLWHLFLLSAVLGVARAFFAPAYVAAVPDIVPHEALPSANAWSSLSVQAAGVVGPAAAGFIVAQGGAPLAFALDACSFVASAACVAGVARLPSLRRALPRSPGAWPDLRAGFSTVMASPWLWVTIGIAGVSNVTLAGPMYAALPLLVEEQLRAGVEVFALLNALAAAGAIVAAICLGHLSRLHRRGLIVYGAWLVVALMALVMGLPVPIIVLATAMLISGAAETVLGLVWMGTLQEPALVPRERLGRVASIDALGSAALLPVGFGLAGIAADRFGPAPVFIAGGTLSAALIALGLLHPAVRNLD